MSTLMITDLRFAVANAALRSKGLLGWACLSLDGTLQLDCLAIRKTAAGGYALSFPCRTDANGVMHPYYKPLAEETRLEIEAQVLGELKRRGLLS